MAQDLATATANYRAAQQAVEDAKTRVPVTQAELRAARAELEDSVVEAAKQGTRMRDLAATTGLSREWIRTLLRKNGVTADD